MIIESLAASLRWGITLLGKKVPAGALHALRNLLKKAYAAQKGTARDCNWFYLAACIPACVVVHSFKSLVFNNLSIPAALSFVNGMVAAPRSVACGFIQTKNVESQKIKHKRQCRKMSKRTPEYFGLCP